MLSKLLKIFVLLGEGDSLLDEQIHWTRREGVEYSLHLKAEAQITPLVRVQGLQIFSWIQILLFRGRRADTLENTLVVKLILHQKLKLLLGKLP